MHLKTKTDLTCRLLFVFFIVVCLLGVSTSIYMNYVDRSLWLDEAMLSYSFGKRSPTNLWDGPFEANQIAPLAWLYVVKLITIAFGNTEFILRIASIVFYILTISALYYYVHSCLDYSKMIAMACAGMYANLPFVLQYSNVFKPYIADGFFVLLTLITFAEFRKRGEKQIRKLCLIWCVLIWFSNPVVFVMAGCLIVEMIISLKMKDWKRLGNLVLIGTCILACFIVYYIFWLRPVAVSDYMQNFWRKDNFPLIPTSLNDLFRIKHSLYQVFRGFGRVDSCLMLVLACFSGIYVIWKKKREHLYIIVSTVVALCVSYLHFFPMSDRLWLFYLPLMVVFCFTVVEDFTYSYNWNYKWKWPKPVLGMIMPLVMVLAAGGIPKYLGKAENVYWPREELNGEIDYLAEHIQRDESVYVYFHSTYGWQYKLGYNNHSIGGFEDNVIYGTVFFLKDMDCEKEINKVLSYDKLYIASSHLIPKRFFQLEQAMKKTGHMELIYYEHRTPLWFFCKDLADSKINATWDYNPYSGMLRIHNIGPAWLNHEYETVRVVDKASGLEAKLPKNIAPGKKVEIALKCGDNARLTLMNEEGIVCPVGRFKHE